jgi:hypothetical protein
LDNTKAVHWILGVALLMIGVFVVVTLVMVNSQADDVTADVTISNVAPSVDSVFVNDAEYDMVDDYGGPGGALSGVISAGSTGTFHVNGVISDENGIDDIEGFSVDFTRFDLTLEEEESCFDDEDTTPTFCYHNYDDTNCTIDDTYGDSTQARYDCEFTIWYVIHATDANADVYSADYWELEVAVEDEEDVDEEYYALEMETVLALDIPSTLSFGTLALGESTTTGNNQEMSITQYGNDDADVQVSMSDDMDCDGSTTDIPKGNVEWSLTDVASGSGTYLTSSSVDTSFNLVAVATVDQVPLSKILYWNIAIPDTGVEGTCTGATTITAIAH